MSTHSAEFDLDLVRRLWAHAGPDLENEWSALREWAENLHAPADSPLSQVLQGLDDQVGHVAAARRLSFADEHNPERLLEVFTDILNHFKIIEMKVGELLQVPGKTLVPDAVDSDAVDLVVSKVRDFTTVWVSPILDETFTGELERLIRTKDAARVRQVGTARPKPATPDLPAPAAVQSQTRRPEDKAAGRHEHHAPTGVERAPIIEQQVVDTEGWYERDAPTREERARIKEINGRNWRAKRGGHALTFHLHVNNDDPDSSFLLVGGGHDEEWQRLCEHHGVVEVTRSGRFGRLSVFGCPNDARAVMKSLLAELTRKSTIHFSDDHYVPSKRRR